MEDAPRLAPGTAVKLRPAGAVQAEDGTEDTELHPAQVELGRAILHHVPANVVAPPAVTDIGSRGGEIRLVVQHLPADIGVAAESDRVAVVAQPAPAREDKGTLAAVAAEIIIMKVI